MDEIVEIELTPEKPNEISNQEAEESLEAHALRVFNQIYTRYSEGFRPFFPRVLVRVLPKDVVYGHILIPDVGKDTHKPTYEGIVLRVWEPIVIPTKHGQATLRSALTPGDHVLFPHFAGFNLPGVDEKYYRCVPEGFFRDGRRIVGSDMESILGILNYPKESVLEIFTRLHDTGKITDGMLIADIVNVLSTEIEMFPKILGSRTTSGSM